MNKLKGYGLNRKQFTPPNYIKHGRKLSRILCSGFMTLINLQNIYINSVLISEI